MIGIIQFFQLLTVRRLSWNCVFHSSHLGSTIQNDPRKANNFEMAVNYIAGELDRLLRKTMTTLYTPDDIMELLLGLFKCYINQDDPSTVHIPESVSHIARKQQTIEWNQMLQGRFSEAWRHYYQQYLGPPKRSRKDPPTLTAISKRSMKDPSARHSWTSELQGTTAFPIPSK